MQTNREPIALKKNIPLKKFYFENSVFYRSFIISLLCMSLVDFTCFFNILKYIKYIWMLLFASCNLILTSLKAIIDQAF